MASNGHPHESSYDDSSLNRQPIRSAQMLVGLLVIFVVIVVFSSTHKGSNPSGALPGNTSLFGCPVGPMSQQEFNPNQSPVELTATWPRSSNVAAAQFFAKYKGCFTYSIAVKGPTNVIGAPKGSSFELTEFWADASQRQITGITHKFEASTLFIAVKYLRSIVCPGSSYRSLGNCVTNTGTEWAYEPSDGG